MIKGIRLETSCHTALELFHTCAHDALIVPMHVEYSYDFLLISGFGDLMNLHKIDQH
jgi:hypothetical protein